MPPPLLPPVYHGRRCLADTSIDPITPLLVPIRPALPLPPSRRCPCPFSLLPPSPLRLPLPPHHRCRRRPCSTAAVSNTIPLHRRCCHSCPARHHPRAFFSAFSPMPPWHRCRRLQVNPTLPLLLPLIPDHCNGYPAGILRLSCGYPAVTVRIYSDYPAVISSSYLAVIFLQVFDALPSHP